MNSFYNFTPILNAGLFTYKDDSHGRSRANQSESLSKPATQYTKTGSFNIAYQVFGSGPVDLVYIPGWISNIDWMWACPELVSFFTELGKMARVILFDKRGTGLSDRVTDFATLEERMEDISAVMDACHSKKAVLFGHSEGGSVSMLFAATFPERVISLMTFGVFAKRQYSEDYPWAPTDEEREKLYDSIRDGWGTDNMEIGDLAPSKTDDPVFMNWLSSYFRFGASPNAALTLTRLNTQVNIIDILPAVEVPVLIMQRTHDIDVKIEEGKYMANMIANARFVELEGSDHLFWIGNTDEVLKEMRKFIALSGNDQKQAKKLVTVLSGKLSDLPEGKIPDHLTESIVKSHHGTFAARDRRHWQAIFRMPGNALRCAMSLREKHVAYGNSLTQAMYLTNDIQQSESQMQPEKEGMSSAILKQALPGQTLVTETVRHLLAGVDVRFQKAGSVYDRVTENIKELLVVREGEEDGTDQSDTGTSDLLDRVVAIIENHLEDESFNINKLSKEIGISERQLQRKIRALTDKSPNQLIMTIRLNSARKLLFHQKYSIAEVAFMAGFSSPSYFSKCFKREFGLSPTSLIS